MSLFCGAAAPERLGEGNMAGRRSHYGYREYRGRNGGRVRAALLFIIALLAVLLAAGVVFTMMVDLEYTDDGVKINWRWAQGGPDGTPPPAISDLLEVESDPLDVTLEPTLEPTPTPLPEYESIGAVSISEAQLRTNAAQAVSAAGGNALVVQMKSDSGQLAWQSQVPLAATLGVNASSSQTAQAVRTLADTSDLYLVARVCCFRDPVLSRQRVGALTTPSGNLWYDYYGTSWSSPADQQAADYISALCLELADMGFDEILLECAGYPNLGEVNVLATNENRPADLTVPVSAFLGRVSGELAEKGVCMSVLTNEKLLPGEAVLSGMNASVLAQNAGRVWLDGGVSAEQYDALLSVAGFDNTAARLVIKGGVTGSWYK